MEKYPDAKIHEGWKIYQPLWKEIVFKNSSLKS